MDGVCRGWEEAGQRDWALGAAFSVLGKSLIVKLEIHGDKMALLSHDFIMINCLHNISRSSLESKHRLLFFHYFH